MKLIPLSLIISVLIIASAIALYKESEPAAVPKPLALKHDYNPDALNKEVAFNEARVTRDPGGAIGFQLLAGAYLARARETQAAQDAAKAEQAARKSLQIRRYNNVAAYWRLGQSLMQQHRFKEAAFAARSGLLTDKQAGACLNLLADAEFEQGHLSKVREIIQNHPTAFPRGQIYLTFTARLAEATGHSELGIRTMRRATELNDKRTDISRIEASWYHTKLGQMLTAEGKHAEADEEFSLALSLYPRDWKALLGRAKVSILQGNPSSAIALAQQATEIAEVMEAKTVLAEAYSNLGDSEASQKAKDELQILHDKEHLSANANETHTHDRQYAEAQLNWNQNLKTSLEMAKQELANRQDSGAYDLLAWAYFKNGNLIEAKRNIEIAYKQGQRTAAMELHYGLIERALHKPFQQHFDKALALGLYPSLQRLITGEK